MEKTLETEDAMLSSYSKLSELFAELSTEQQEEAVQLMHSMNKLYAATQLDRVAAKMWSDGAYTLSKTVTAKADELR